MTGKQPVDHEATHDHRGHYVKANEASAGLAGPDRKPGDDPQPEKAEYGNELSFCEAKAAGGVHSRNVPSEGRGRKADEGRSR